VALKQEEPQSMPNTASTLQESEEDRQVPAPDLVEQFITELKSLGGECLACTPLNLARTISTLLQTRAIQRVLVDQVGLEILSGTGLELVNEPDPTCQAGLTRAVAGLADTGSLLVMGGPLDLLSASLLPEVHIAILNRSDLYASLPDVLNTPAVRAAPAAVVISGPSRTADIEMTLTIGVHGPGELIVLLVDDSTPAVIK
jgi:L-lactate dehydrogenase complex protein LldG